MSEWICLLVDDEPSIRTYIRAILQRERFSCLEAESAPQALSIVQKLGGRVDLIVTDIKMPGDMDGIDLAQAVRTAYPTVPVIVISGYAEEERVPVGFQFIRKPFTPETILNAVRKAVPLSDSASTSHDSGAH